MTSTTPVTTGTVPPVKPIPAVDPASPVTEFELPLASGELAAVAVIAQDSVETLDTADGAAGDGDLMDPADLPAAVIVTGGEDGFVDPMEPSEVSAIVVVDEAGQPVDLDDPDAAAIVVVTGDAGDGMISPDGSPMVTTTVLVPDTDADTAAEIADALDTGGTGDVVMVTGAEPAEDAEPIDEGSPLTRYVRETLSDGQGGLIVGGGTELATALRGESDLGPLTEEETREMLRAASDIWAKSEVSSFALERSIYEVRRGMAFRPDLFHQLYETTAERAGQYLETRDPNDVNGLQLAALSIKLHAGIGIRFMASQLTSEDKTSVISMALKELSPNQGVNVWQALDARVYNGLPQFVARKMSDVLSDLAPVASSRILSTTSQGVTLGDVARIFSEDESHLPKTHHLDKSEPGQQD
ncbi:MAG: hypothetical protein AAFR17_09220 [Pseudomonadota bacterium]